MHKLLGESLPRDETSIRKRARCDRCRNARGNRLGEEVRLAKEGAVLKENL